MGLGGYTAFVRVLADLSVQFGKPVLLINGDSHVYGTDQPLADPHSAAGLIHNTQAVANLPTRITVQGGTSKPREWLRLTIDPQSAQVFSWEKRRLLRRHDLSAVGAASPTSSTPRPALESQGHDEPDHHGGGARAGGSP